MPLRRILLLAALGAAVPVSAFAVEGEPQGGSGASEAETTAPSGAETGGSKPEPGGSGAGITVSVVERGCGVSETQILCELDASWTGVPGAEYYAVSVTRADGSIQDFGRVDGGEGGGSASLWVPYVGSGTYSVVVSAYGTPPNKEDSDKEELLDRGSSHAGHNGGDADGKGGGDGNGDGDGKGDGDGNGDVTGSGSTGHDQNGSGGQDESSKPSSGDQNNGGPAGQDTTPTEDREPDPAPTPPECEAEEPASAGEPATTEAARIELYPEGSEASGPPAPDERVECVEPAP